MQKQANQSARTNLNATRNIIAASITAGLAAMAAIPAQAQTTSTVPASITETAEANNDNSVVTIYVTANRRKEKSKDVAGSINALGGGQIEKLGISGIADFASYVPGLAVIGDRPGFQQQAIRGISTGAWQTNATVGTYVDDTPVSFNSAYAQGSLFTPDPDPFDLDRIEVLKGPQGSLYGASALGGLIKYVTVAPNLQEFEGRVELGVNQIKNGGSGNSLRAVVNVPIKEDLLAVRASLFDRNEAGYYDHITSGKNDVNSMKISGGRVSALLKPNADFNARLTVEQQTIKADDASSAQADPLSLKPTNGDLLKINWKFPAPSNTELNRSNLTLNYNAGFANLLSSTSVARDKSHIIFDFSTNYGPDFYSPGGADTASWDEVFDIKKTTQEFRLTSPGNQSLDWLVGLFYTKEDTTVPFWLDVLKGPSGGPFAMVFPRAMDGAQVAMMKDTSVYANVTYKLSEPVDVQFGFRRAVIDQTYEQVFEVFGTSVSPPGVLTSNEQHTTWLLSPRWRIDANTMIFARAATGYRPGGPNVTYTPDLPRVFESDKLLNLEFGIKQSLPTAKFDYTATLFNIDWKQIQVQGFDANGWQFTGNGGQAHTRGLELEGNWRPTTAWRLSANAALTAGKLDQDIAVSGIDAKKGDKIPYVAPFSFAMTADYSQTVWSDTRGVFGISLRHVGERNAYFDHAKVGVLKLGAQSYVGKLPAYDLLDLRAAFSRDIWTLTFFLKNVFDKRGLASINGISVGPGTLPGSVSPCSVTLVQPRTLAVTLQANF